jgi:class 3 adenylate cyclase
VALLAGNVGGIRRPLTPTRTARCSSSYDLHVSSSGERKVVTVLFADITGSTQFADHLDPEELRDVMSAWFATVRSEIEAQGGTVEKYIGDAVMAVFGAPIAHEDDPARALRAALGMRERLVELNEELRASIEMEIRIGINTGEAIAAIDPPPGEAIVTGLAVNAAARLEQLAEPGQTVVAERTVRAAPGFRFDKLGDLDLRGSEAPVTAFLLRNEQPHGESRGLHGLRAPLVGRERELDLLVTLYDRVVAEGRPHLATIYGDPGVGKSRLVRELIRRLAQSGGPPRVLVGRCLSYGDGIAYWPLAEILKRVAEISVDTRAAEALTRLDSLVDDVVGDASPLARGALAFTLGLDDPEGEFSRLQPSAVRAELHRVWRTFLSALTERQPLLVVVDDIHWADAALLDLLEEVAERAQGRLLVVCPARPSLADVRPTWGGGRRSFSSLVLSPLSADASRELVANLLDVDGLTDSARTKILESAEGNPFFLEEILRQLIDQERIVQRDGRWRTSEYFGDLELPDTVQGVLAARIDLLEPDDKRTLQQASVVGRIFWRGAVAALVGDEAVVDPGLRRLEDRELVALRLGSTMAGEEELAFSHILTRDVAYESLPRRDRPAAHARVAAWIETTTGDRQREFAGLLAHHYLEAYRGARRDRGYAADDLDSLRRRAFDLLLDATRTALKGAAYGGARALAEAATEVAATPAERADALELLAHGFRHAVFGDDAYRTFLRAAEELASSELPDPQRAANLYAQALETAVRWAGTLATVPDEPDAARALATALTLIDDTDSEAHVRLLTVRSFWAHGYRSTTVPDGDPATALATGEAAVAMALRLGRPDLAVVALDGVQHNLNRQLRYAAAYEATQRRLELAKTAGDLNELGDSYAVAAWSAAYLGSFREARAIGLEGFELLRSDAPSYAGHSLSWAALAAYYLGDWDEVLDGVELVRAAHGERGESPKHGFAGPWPAAALVHDVRGDRTAAERLLAEIAAIERDRGEISAHLSPPLVELLVVRGEIQAARERLNQVLAQEARKDNLPLICLAEAELVLAEGDLARTTELVARVRELGTLTGAAYLTPLEARLEGRAAEAADGYEALGMAVYASLARLDAAEAAVETGHPDAVRESLALALPALERAGHRPALARAAALRERVGD